MSVQAQCDQLIPQQQPEVPEVPEPEPPIEVEELDLAEELDASPEGSQLQGEEGQATEGFQGLQVDAGQGSQEEEGEPEPPQERCHSPATREAIAEFLTGFGPKP